MQGCLGEKEKIQLIITRHYWDHLYGNSPTEDNIYHLYTCIDYRPCAGVGVVHLLYLKVYDFPHTRRHFVGQRNSSNVHVDPLLASYQQY